MRVEDVSLYGPEITERWYETYDVLREEAPVYRVPDSDVYVLTRYEDIVGVIRNTELFPNGLKGSERLLGSDEAWRIYNEEGFGRVSPISTDPPVHRRYRTIVDPPFSTQGAKRYQYRMAAITHELIDTFVERGECDFFAEFCTPLPVRIITEVLGLPVEDIPRLKQWSALWVRPFARGLTAADEVEVAQSGVEFQRYLLEKVQERREHPTDDVISHFITAIFADERPLTDKEIVNMVEHLYIGGNETTTFALSSAMWLLLTVPGVYDELRLDRSLIRNFVEEVLRCESPTMGLYRYVARDTEIAGVPIPAGSTLHIRFAAGNRDPRMFAEPGVFDLHRANAWRHMAFSLGEHHCPGAGLSRLEQNVAWDILLDRLPNLALADGKNDFSHQPGFVLRALRELHITWDTPGS